VTADPAPPAPAPTRRAARPDRLFGFKDVFTTINALGGAIAIFLCIEGEPYWAGMSMLLGYLCGDTLDGWVARRLGTSNDFGSEYDTIADHLAHCIAPGAIVFTVYRTADLGVSDDVRWVIAAALGSSIMVTASIRHARNVVRSISVKGVWFGMPRTILGFLPVSFVDSEATAMFPGGYWIGVALIPLLCATALTYLPYPNHHLPRGHHPVVKVVIGLFFITTVGAVVLRPSASFDVLFFWSFTYATGSWLAFTPAERRSYREVVRRGLDAGAAAEAAR